METTKKEKRAPLDVYELVKRVMTKGTIHYPQKALYENFLRTKAQHWGTIPDCDFIHGETFGISVVPKCYSDKYHQGLICNLIDLNTNKRIYMWEVGLRHQLYLHDIVLKKWRMEADGMRVQIRIDCKPKTMSVTAP